MMGCHCAQSCAAREGESSKTVRPWAAACTDWCGAVTGAFLVIGLKHGRVRAEDAASRDRTYALVQDFIARFTARHGEIKCRDLLGCDIGTPEGQKKAEEMKLHQTKCEDLVRDAAVILEEIL